MQGSLELVPQEEPGFVALITSEAALIVVAFYLTVH